MKKILTATLLVSGLILSMQLQAQSEEDKSKRASPPASVTQKINSGATITINYSQPSVKGRVIGKDVEPMDGKVWRTGANEATVFETDKDVMIDGKKLAAGKYSLFTIFNGHEVTVIFNKTWNQWGAFKYKEADDALRIKTKYTEGPHTEKMTFMISKEGVVTLLWGTRHVSFKVH